jgi:hypothetical protein
MQHGYAERGASLQFTTFVEVAFEKFLDVALEKFLCTLVGGLSKFRARGLERSFRMGGRAVECTGLEIRQSRKRFVGSNPTPSAR